MHAGQCASCITQAATVLGAFPLTILGGCGPRSWISNSNNSALFLILFLSQLHFCMFPQGSLSDLHSQPKSYHTCQADYRALVSKTRAKHQLRGEYKRSSLCQPPGVEVQTPLPTASWYLNHQEEHSQALDGKTLSLHRARVAPTLGIGTHNQPVSPDG